VNAIAEPLWSGLRRLARFGARRRAAVAPCGVVLMYHRIAEPVSDPWDLAVSPRNFADHLAVLARFGPVGTLAEMRAALDRPAPPRRVFAVTFDDGYRDNLVAALPALTRAGVGATVFVASGLTGSDREFWWDTLARALLECPTLPGHLHLRLGGGRHDWRLGPAPGRARRMRLIASVRSELMRLEPAAIEAAITEIAAWAGIDRAGAAANHPMDLAELQAMAASGQIEIGGHTHSHAALTLIAPEAAAAEIARGRAVLRDRTGQPVTSFAYPYGLHDGHGVAAVRAAGFDCACTVRPGIADAASDPFRIPRIQVKDWPAERFETEIASFAGRADGT